MFKKGEAEDAGGQASPFRKNAFGLICKKQSN